ncbi:MAG: hypothetical protein ACXAC7_15690 [Candidatus Hodarchaeales archaeon]|jgi:hypothetical protein
MDSGLTHPDILKSGDQNQISNFHPNKQLGIFLSFVSLLLLGILSIISNSRPLELNALDYTLYLSIWQLI